MIIDAKNPCPECGSFRIPERVADLLINGECPATYVAIYVYVLRQYEADNKNISNDLIAETLKVSLIDVVNAFLFFSSQGLLKIHNFTSVDNGDFDIEFCFDAETSVCAPPFRPCYRPSEISRRLSENPRMSQMYKMVGQILGKTLSSADTELLYSFHDYYGLPVEVIIVLIEYYVSKDKRSMKFIEKEVSKWASAGVNTIKKAKAYIEKREAFLSYAGQVRTVLGIHERRLSTRELTYINNWQNQFAMPIEMVKLAFEATVNQTGKLSFAYMNKILESWAQNNIRKVEDVQKKKQATKDTRSDRYNFADLQRRTFEAINTPTERKTDNGI